MKPTQDGPVVMSTRRFTDAVNALTARQPFWDGGVCRYQPSTYRRLRAALKTATPPDRRSVAASRLPCHTAVLALLVDVDITVAEWQPAGDDTPDRLNRLSTTSWRPQDCDQLDAWTAQLARWTVTAAELLTDTVAVALRVPCPRCGTRFVYRPNGAGENVRGWALRVTEDGANCQHCHASWAPDQFEFLATLIGAPALPA